MSLFSKAKKEAKTTTTKAKEKKASIVVRNPEFFKKVQMLEVLQENLKRDKAKADILTDEVKEIAKYEWTSLYQKTGKNPGSVILEAELNDEVAQVMFVPYDKYITINPDRAEALVEKFGEKIVEEKTTFSFDAAMVEKYGEIISRLIEESNEIDDDDKSKIIKAVTTFSVTKGTIDKLETYGIVSDIMEEVKPVVSIKNVEVIKD